ncbi:MAG: hypothetical protein HC786_19570 [Richelia sp. CSU_2_1]|nr:hypothetical protein [Richelia sp. CSU_2_1]
MKTSVLSIQHIDSTNEFKVLMLIGDDRQQFTFTVEHPQQESFAVIGGDIDFCNFFRFNQHISAKVGDLVGQVDRDKIVELPVGVGDFYTPEEAMELQKHFRQSDRIINYRPTEAMRSEVRDRVIELVEKLPESMLDEAIKVLESLYLNANNLK